MADRETKIVVNFAAGQDDLTPALAKQRQEAAGLADQVGEVLAREKEAAALRRAVAAERTAQAGGPAAELQGRAQQVIQREQEAAELRRAVAQERVRQAGGIIPANQVSVAGAPGLTAGRGVSGERAVSIAAAAARGDLQGLGSAVSGVGGVVGKVAAGLGIAGVAIGAVVGVVGALAVAFQRFRPSIQEVVDEVQEATERLGRQRTTGEATQADIRRALGPEAFRAVAEAQRQGGPGAAQQITQTLAGRVQSEQARAQQLAGRNLGEEQARAEAALMQMQAMVREIGPGAVGLEAYQQRQAQAQQAFIAAGLGGRREVIEMVSSPSRLREMRPEEIRAQTGLIGQAQTGAQANAQVLQNVLRQGFLPSLAAGALTPQSMPGFQSRQVDVLDIPGLVQIEATRDDREQQRFDAQMRAWTEWNQQLRTILTQGAVS